MIKKTDERLEEFLHCDNLLKLSLKLKNKTYLTKEFLKLLSICLDIVSLSEMTGERDEAINRLEEFLR